MSKTYRKKLVLFYNTKSDISKKIHVKGYKVVSHYETNNSKFYDYILWYPHNIKMIESQNENVSGLIVPYHKNGDLHCFALKFCKHSRLLKVERNKTKQDLNQIIKYQNVNDFDDTVLVNKKRFKCKTQPSKYRF